MHVDHNMHVIVWNMHVTCTLFRIGFLSFKVPVSFTLKRVLETQLGMEREKTLLKESIISFSIIQVSTKL